MITDKAKKLNNLFQRSQTARSSAFTYRKNCEEFYLNDVESTRSQLTQSQKDFIDKTYNIPISTKYTYPIIEQILSFLTGSKPFPRLIASSESTENIPIIYEDGYQGVWYESKSDRELKKALQDMLVTGSGFMKVRNNSFYQETTFNVTHEYVTWREIYIDPFCKKMDLTDADYVIHAYTMPKAKAEREFDITIDDTETSSILYIPLEDSDSDGDFFNNNAENSDYKLVLIREYYQKKEVNVYISENGQISLKRPTPTEIPNPDKQTLGEQIAQLQQQIQQSQQLPTGQQLSEDTRSAIPNANNPDDMAQIGQLDQQGQQIGQEEQGQSDQIAQQLQQMSMMFAQMPDTVPANKMLLEDGSVIIAREVIKVKKKRILRTLMVQDSILEEEYLPCDKYPIIHYWLNDARNPNRTYGIVHFILDLVKALNKFWSLLLYDMQTNNHKKVIYFQGTVEKIADIERSWSIPNAWIEIIGDPSLPNNGMPVVVEPTPVNQAISYVLQSLQQMIEYITGIYGVMQGDNQGAPSTFGGIQSLQSFGTQRVKLYSRAITPSLEDLAYVTVCFLQRYAPKDKITEYFDSDGQKKTVEFMSSAEDMKFKVRVDITSSLPTVRMMTAQLLGTVAGQTKNPQVADFLTQYMLKTMDLAEGKEASEQIDVIKQMQQQMQQLEMQLDTETKKNKAMENNMYQKELAHRMDLAGSKAQSQIDLAANDATNEINNTAQQQVNQSADTEEVPF